MKLLITVLAFLLVGYVASSAISHAVSSGNQARAQIAVAEQVTQQTKIEWGARVDIARIEADRDVSVAGIEADRDVSVAGIHRDEVVWSSWPWNVGSIIRGLLWVLAGAFGLLLVVAGVKSAQ